VILLTPALITCVLGGLATVQPALPDVAVEVAGQGGIREFLWEFIKKFDEPLVLFGFAGQFVFMTRFLIQWYISEKKKRSTVPVIFWYISTVGGLMLFTYGLLDRDPVICLGQGLGVMIYLRNLVLIHRRRRLIMHRRKASNAAHIDANKATKSSDAVKSDDTVKSNDAGVANSAPPSAS